MINKIWNTYKYNNTKCKYLDKTRIGNILTNIIAQIIHVKVGNTVCRYRDLKLRRVNDVSFRKKLLVKLKIKKEHNIIDPKKQKYKRVTE